MDTLLLNANLPDDVSKAAQIIKDGGLVAFATETVYGLGGLALNEKSIQKIFDAKERPAHNPLIVHVSSTDQARALFDFSKSHDPQKAKQRFETLADYFWPGPLTLVGNKSSTIPNLATAGLNKVAVRIPNHPIALSLLSQVKEPVVAPSANASNRPSSTCAEHVVKTLSGKIDAVLDAGSCQYGLESTVVDISTEKPLLLRMGAISAQTLMGLLPDLGVRPLGQTTHESHGSPGLVSKHYAPLNKKIDVADFNRLNHAWNTPTALLLRQSTAQKLEKEQGPRLGPIEILSDDPVLFAHDFYAALYRLEGTQLMHVLIEEVPNEDLWQSVKDRILRASSDAD